MREAEPPSVHLERVATLEQSKGAAEGHIQQLNSEHRYTLLPYIHAKLAAQLSALPHRTN